MTREHKFLEDALQGLAFWIGHRESLFYNYPLSESALVAEACSLIQSRLLRKLDLLPERMYKDLVPPNKAHQEEFGRLRSDLVICSKPEKSIYQYKNIHKNVKFVIEVKRERALKKHIDADLYRLAKYLKASNNDSRAFLFLISQSKKPCARFVNEAGNAARPGSLKICDVHVRYQVRRVLKAAASFKSIGSANYACLIEVLRCPNNNSRDMVKSGA